MQHSNQRLNRQLVAVKEMVTRCYSMGGAHPLIETIYIFEKLQASEYAEDIPNCHCGRIVDFALIVRLVSHDFPLCYRL
jgi:hypothetical protein